MIDLPLIGCVLADDASGGDMATSPGPVIPSITSDHAG
jgi:hypothetical protein